jgi:hypothetical protein
VSIFPICIHCKHLNLSRKGPMRCAACPREIPTAILLMEHDHRRPYAGDHGIRYEPRDAAAAAIEPATKPQ